MGNKSSCPTQGDRVVELIYIDIVGLTQFKKTLGPSWVHYQYVYFRARRYLGLLV